MSLLDRALRMGEAKKFKAYEQRVGRINLYEEELKLESDSELREKADNLRERARDGEVLQNMQHYEEKRLAYACDVTYGTNSEFGFDYLRDNMATSLEEKVQHGGREKPDEGQSPYHTFAIVDEVDNILIDEARTPLIISGAPEQAADLYQKFAKLAPQMQPGKPPEGLDPRAKKEFVADFDYEFDEKHKTVAITERGVAKAERFLGIDHLYRAENGP